MTTKEVTNQQTGEIQDVRMPPLPTAQEYGYERRVSDLIPTPDAWQEYPQVELDELVGQDIALLDVMMFDSQQYEGKQWGVLLYKNIELDEIETTLVGGDVIMRKLRTLKEWTRSDGTVGAFPCVGRILSKPSRTKGNHDYYDLI